MKPVFVVTAAGFRGYIRAELWGRERTLSTAFYPTLKEAEEAAEHLAPSLEFLRKSGKAEVGLPKGGAL